MVVVHICLVVMFAAHGFSFPVSGLKLFDPCEVTVVIPEDHRQWCVQLQSLLDEGSLDEARDVGLAWTGGALLGVADGKWEDAKTAALNGIRITCNIFSPHQLCLSISSSYVCYHCPVRVMVDWLCCSTSFL